MGPSTGKPPAGAGKRSNKPGRSPQNPNSSTASLGASVASATDDSIPLNGELEKKKHYGTVRALPAEQASGTGTSSSSSSSTSSPSSKSMTNNDTAMKNTTVNSTTDNQRNTATAANNNDATNSTTTPVTATTITTAAAAGTASASTARPSSQAIAASTSFFGIPSSISMTGLRTTPSMASFRNFPIEDSPEAVDWNSLYVVYAVTLVAEAARGLMLPSTWPYYHSLGGTKASLGVFVASFSLGRMFSTIPLGYLSDNFSIGFVLIVASLFQIVGHLAYAVAPSVPIVFIARTVVGFGSATMSVCRAHLTRAIPPSMRTHHFAYLSGLQFIGFAVLPGLGGIIALLPNVNLFSVFALNGFTYPAYMLMIANIICVALISWYYVDPPRAIPRLPSRRSMSIQRLNAAGADHHLQPLGPDTFALTVCLLLNLVFRGVIAEFETVTIPFMMEQFDVSFRTGSYFLSAVGFIGLLVYLSFKPISKRFSDRLLVLAGLLCVILGCAPLAAYPLVSHMPLVIYVLCLGLTWSLAFPIGQTAVLALFSKVLYGLPAGGLLGIFSASGSIARLCMAILASQIWNQFGREAVYLVIVAYVLVSVILVGASYNRLKPRLYPNVPR